MPTNQGIPAGADAFAALPRDTLERITMQMASSLRLEEVLNTITQGLVTDLEAALARIWLLGPGDLCACCSKAADCAVRIQCLHLKASAGLHTRLDGEYQRIPLGALKIGRIAQGEGPLWTNDVLHDPRLPNTSWMRQHHLQAFVGYPLRFQDELLGVLALFCRRSLSPEELQRLPVFAHQAAITIKNAQLFEEVERLKNQLQADNAYLQEELHAQHRDILSQSASMRRLLAQVEQVAPTDATVLLLGETGTGKELLARAVHHLSPRRERPLIKVNCAALPATLIESELFGHEKGAFTGATARRPGRFELAHQGTIFLDEIGDLPLDVQGKLLRVLQEGECERLGGTRTLQVDVRVVAATNRDLQQAVAQRTFRDDLYYRLNVFPLAVPPLRQRRDDIALLVQHFVRRFSQKMHKRIRRIPQHLMDALQAYDWPGNVRELENIIERAVIMSNGSTLALDETALPRPSSVTPTYQGQTLADVERQHILHIVRATGGRIEGPQGAAIRLGLNPSTLRSRMRKMGLAPRQHPEVP